MNAHLTTAFTAVSAAEKIALTYWRNTLHIRTKSDARDLVTQADLACDRAIRKIIHAAFPTHDILSEELGDDARVSEYTWVIDPIDGTINFTMGEPIFGVSIGLLHKGKPVLGMISLPAIGERYWAEAGRGAWVQRTGHAKRRCHVSSVSRMQDARFSMGFNVTQQSRKKFLRTFKPFLLEAAVPRVHFCAVFDFMNIARGGMDFYINYDINLWDYAAAWCIVQEAGGHMYDISGKSLTGTNKPTHTLATNGIIDKQVFASLRS